MTFKIIGTGVGLPQKCVLSEEFDKIIGRPEGWLQAETGVRKRPVIGPGESQITLAVTAARNALDDAGIARDEIDLIVAACGIGYQALPSTAPLLMKELGIADGTAVAFDVDATCLSFVVAVDLAGAYFDSGRYNTILIVSSDIASRALPWDGQPDVAALFGDGAAAAVLQRTGSRAGAGLVASLFRTYPSGYDSCQIGAGGTRFDFSREHDQFAAHSKFVMNGRDLFRLTSKHFVGFVDDLLAKAGWDRDDIDLIIPHQASPFALAHMVRQCKFDGNKVVNITDEYGNQIAASIPIALDLARKEGRVPLGARVLILGTSAGVSFGGLALVA